MSLGNPINIRLDLEKQLKYEEEASIKKISLSRHLRNRLNESDQFQDQLIQIRKDLEILSARSAHQNVEKENLNIEKISEKISNIEHKIEQISENILNKSNGKKDGSVDQSALLEILFLLRQTTDPMNLRMAQNEMKRLEISVWSEKKTP